jgi:pSer/pThr/pTyr-binding forkhead associated (FHA) protein
VTLVDVSSTNGCFVNDEKVTKHRLRAGDLVRIGDRSFRFACA